jgi:hypothetical protein
MNTQLALNSDIFSPVELDDGKALDWVELIPAGPNISGRDGRSWLFDDAAIDLVQSSFTTRAIDLPIDREHATQHRATVRQDAPAGAWIKQLDICDGTLWGQVEWTPRAAQQVENREYRFLSPVFDYVPDIGGFDVGFENAGYRTAWQVELNPVNRAVLADRFPHAQQFEDVRQCGVHNLSPVDVITGGFPCQDISLAGRKPTGLRGERSGLFWEVIRILKETQPRWVVLENVVNLLAVNDSQDFETVIRALADCGYVGFWRVLNAQYFGVPQQRRRIFLVAGHRRMPPPWSCWLTPRQWTQYLQRLARSSGHGPRMHGLPILYWREQQPHKSLWAAHLSSLSRTDGVRWLSGSERLKMMGFASDWMRPTLRRLSLPETPSLRRSRNGLRED